LKKAACHQFRFDGFGSDLLEIPLYRPTAAIMPRDFLLNQWYSARTKKKQAAINE
jgi:hypothetical protein